MFALIFVCNFKPAAQIWLVPLEIVFNLSRFKPALNWNQLLADFSRGSNLLNSGSGYVPDLQRQNFWIFDFANLGIKFRLFIFLNPIKAGGGRLAPPPCSFFALALSFVTLSPWNFWLFINSNLNIFFYA